MVTMIFEYDIPAEKQAEYIRVTREEIKPLWESIGCIAYDIWKVADSETAFVKTMLYENASLLKESMAREEADSVKKIFGEFAENVSRKMCTKMTQS